MLKYLHLLGACKTNYDVKSTHVQHLSLLIEYLTDRYATKIKRLNALLDHGEISFNLLWLLFQPNMLVCTICSGSDQPRCLRFSHGQTQLSPQNETTFNLNCQYLDFDGKVFGEVTTTLSIAEFQGVKKINTLDVFPLQYHEQKEEVKSTLCARGRRFISLRGMHHVNYKGNAFLRECGKPVKGYVEGRVMIDASEFSQNNANYSSSHFISRSDIFSLQDDSLKWGYNVRQEKDSTTVKSNSTVLSEMREEDLMICKPSVLGYSFSNRLWGEWPAHLITT